MSERKDPRPTKDAAQSPERIDPRSGFRRLKKAMKKILKVPKDKITDMGHAKP